MRRTIPARRARAVVAGRTAGSTATTTTAVDGILTDPLDDLTHRDPAIAPTAGQCGA